MPIAPAAPDPRRRRPGRPERPRIDLSKKPGNPTSELEKHYQELKALASDSEAAAAKAVEIIQPLVGKGMSERNYSKFMLDLNKAKERNRVFEFLTNYILKGSGLGVMDDVEAIASFVSEDINNLFVELTDKQRALKKMAESAGFSVGLLQAAC